MASPTPEPSIVQVASAGALSWILPGLGHIYLGQRRRGLILLIVITMTFWCGVAIGGVQSTVQPRSRTAWFMAQICAGSHTLVTYAWGQVRARPFPNERAGFVAADVAVIYTGVAGLLNILIILDALASADPNYVRVGARPPPRSQDPDRRRQGQGG